VPQSLLCLREPLKFIKCRRPNFRLPVESGLLGKIPDERRSENRQRQKRKPGAGPGATRRIEGKGSTGVRLIS
jgi:hypothetical protein